MMLEYFMLNKIKRIYETIRYKFWLWRNRPWMVDCRNKDFPYNNDYMEPGDLILLANFALLVRFVEENEPFKYHYAPDKIPPTLEQTAQELGVKDLDDEWLHSYHYGTLEQHRIGVEIKELYDWWTKVRKKEREACERILEEWSSKRKENLIDDILNSNSDASWREWSRTERELDAKDQLMLERLIVIRQNLWT